jgi:hypothetical protein
MSGVRQIALILPDILGIGLTGFIVTKWGYYVSARPPRLGPALESHPDENPISSYDILLISAQVPYMVAGTMIASVGAGLLTTIDVAIPTMKWAAYLVVTGIGVGMAFQLPYTAVQAVLEYDPSK